MHRIDGPAAAPGGLFTEGDPNVGTPATVVTDDWLNAVQEEISGVVEASGAALAKPDNTQLLAAIKALLDVAVPPGQIAPFAFQAVPAGWSVCDGGALSRTAEARLFAKIGTTFGAGDGSTTFNKPDLRGEVIRGWDAGRGVDVDRAFGSWQADQIKAHTHATKRGQAPTNTSLGGVGFDNPADDGLTGSTGGNETRMRNVAALYCIRL